MKQKAHNRRKVFSSEDYLSNSRNLDQDELLLMVVYHSLSNVGTRALTRQLVLAGSNPRLTRIFPKMGSSMVKDGKKIKQLSTVVVLTRHCWLKFQFSFLQASISFYSPEISFEAIRFNLVWKCEVYLMSSKYRSTYF